MAIRCSRRRTNRCWGHRGFMVHTRTTRGLSKGSRRHEAQDNNGNNDPVVSKANHVGDSFLCSVPIRVHGELEDATVRKLQFLKKSAVRTILGGQSRSGNFVAGFQAAPVFPAHAGPAKGAWPAEFES